MSAALHADIHSAEHTICIAQLLCIRPRCTSILRFRLGIGVCPVSVSSIIDQYSLQRTKEDIISCNVFVFQLLSDLLRLGQEITRHVLDT